MAPREPALAVMRRLLAILLLSIIIVFSDHKSRMKMSKMPHPFYRSSFRCDCGHFNKKFVVRPWPWRVFVSCRPEPRGVQGAEADGDQRDLDEDALGRADQDRQWPAGGEGVHAAPLDGLCQVSRGGDNPRLSYPRTPNQGFRCGGALINKADILPSSKPVLRNLFCRRRTAFARRPSVRRASGMTRWPGRSCRAATPRGRGGAGGAGGAAAPLTRVDYGVAEVVTVISPGYSKDYR